MMRFWREYWPLIVAILLNIAVHAVWVLKSGFFTFGDAGVWLPDTQNELIRNSLAAYSSNLGLGGISVTGSYDLIQLFYGLLGKLGIHYQYAFRILLLWPYLVLAPVAAYLFALKILRSRVGAFIATLVVMFNTYSLILQGGHLLVLMADSLLLLFLYFAYKLFAEGYRRADLIKLIVTGVVFSSYEFRIFYIGAGITVLMAIYYAILQKKWRPLLTGCIALVIILLINMPWLLALNAAGVLSSNDLFTRGLFGSQFFDITSAFTLFHRFWTGAQPAIFVSQPIPIYFWLVPLLAFAGLAVNRKNRAVVFFGSIALIGILLTKQTAQPFPSLYQWLYDHMPGFSAFREASKFYFLIAFGYAIMIGGLVAWVWKNWHSKPWHLYAKVALTLGVAGLFLWNVKPIVNGSIGTLFVPHHLPADYDIFNRFIQKQPEYFRTYWLPVDSRWAVYTNQHPKISGADVVQGPWKDFVSTKPADSGAAQNQLTDIFHYSYSNKLFDSASVKYVVVPLKDAANNDDFFIYYGGDRNAYVQQLDQVSWLKRINIGTQELAVYENQGYSPHISAAAKGPVVYDDLLNVESKHRFMELTGHDADFILKTPMDTGLAELNNIFSTFDLKTSLTSLSLRDTVISKEGETARIFKNQSSMNLRYEATNSSVVVYEKPFRNPTLNGLPLTFPGADDRRVLATAPISPSQDLFVLVDNLVVPVVPGKVLNIGGSRRYGSASISSLDPNQIANGSFESGLWEKATSDCNQYDSHPLLGMKLSRDQYTDGKQSLQLEASAHIACTGTSFNVKDGTKNVLSFNYRSPDSKIAGYNLVFDDPAKTVLRDTTQINSPNKWDRYLKEVDVPPGARTATISLYAYESSDKAKNTVFYDNVTFATLKEVAPILLTKPSGSFRELPVHLNAGVNAIDLNSNEYDTRNLIDNPSFETGLWDREVNDCNNYDASADLSQQLNTDNHTDGRQSLQLEATRHTACTKQSLTLNAGGDHLLSFDYQSPNSKKAGFALNFDDPAKTTITDQISINGKDWHQLKKKVTVPNGATYATLNLYAYESDGVINNTVRYDNLSLTKIPDIDNTYFVLTNPTVQIEAPKNIEYKAVSTGEQLVKIQGASKPFMLKFSESFHPQWGVYLQPLHEGAQSAFTNLFLGFKPSPFEGQHTKLNGFANGWIMDPAYIKANYTKDFYVENPDGSIDLNLKIYFKPQSYFNAGLLISGLTIVAGLAYIAWNNRHIRHRKKVRDRK